MRRRTWRWPWASLSVCVIVALIVFGVPLGFSQDGGGGGAGDTSAADGSSGSGPCSIARGSEVPRFIHEAFEPSVVRLSSDCLGTDDEVRLWLGDASGVHASRVWNGSAWVSSSFYVDSLGFGTDGDGGVLVPVRVDPEAAGASVVLSGQGGAGVWVAIRGAGGSGDVQTVHVGDFSWTRGAPSATWVVAGTKWLQLRDGDGELVVSGALGVDSFGRPLPPQFGRFIVPPSGLVGFDLVGEGRPPLVPGDVLLTHVVPTFADRSAGGVDGVEAVVLRALAGTVDDLSGLWLSDGEGSVFADDAPVTIGEPFVWSSHQVSRLSGLGSVDAAWGSGPDVDVTVLDSWGNLALANTGDEVRLTYGDQILDAFVYGKGDPGPPTGGWSGPAAEAGRIEDRVLVRSLALGPWLGAGSVPAELGGFLDSNSSTDWDAPRMFRAQQTDKSVQRFVAEGPLRAFVCPDRCFEEVMARIDAAERSIDLWLYDLSMLEPVEALVDAAERGVTIRAFLEGLPVASSDDKKDRIAWAVDRLVEAGAEVRTHERHRFDHMHAKTFVVDGQWTVALSENANLRGWPPDGVSGNRGWGVAVYDAALGSWMTDLFVADFAHPTDARPVRGVDLAPEARDPRWGAVDAPAPGRLPTLVVDGSVAVTPMVAPDHSGVPERSPLVALLGAAEDEVLVQQMALPLAWTRPGHITDSPLTAALAERIDSGLRVRGVLAGDFEDGDIGTPGNDRTVFTLSRRAYDAFGGIQAEAVPDEIRLGAFRLGDAPVPDEGVVHNKGWIIDPDGAGAAVVVGSMNGNLASQALNREIGLIIEDARVAGWYRDVFEQDLAAAPATDLLLGAPDGGGTGRSERATSTVPGLVLVMAVAVMISWARRRIR